jgi:tRNA-binding protein
MLNGCIYLYETSPMKPTITFDDFQKINLCVGTILHVEPLPNARKPAFVVTVDFGTNLGIKTTSAQITDLYSPETLIGKQIIGVVNFPSKQIGNLMSEFLLTGFVQQDGSVVIAVPERPVENGLHLA